MDLAIRRIAIFTTNMPRMVAFYRNVIGLKQVSDEVGWKEFSAGGCNIALHNGASVVGKRAPKLVFFAKNVATTREALTERGAKFGAMKSKNGLDLCEGKDPDGNPFQISNRQ
jgi:catechol 2,3-dioxygenase-like lactoylglutathione lyase family enzyme